MPVDKITVREKVSSIEQLDPDGYIAANNDLRIAGADARSHFMQWGWNENRFQYRVSEIARLRAEKLARLAFRRPPTSATPKGSPQTFLSAKQITDFDIPDEPPVSENNYNKEVQAIIDGKPDGLFLDVGAGLRWTYYGNVVNTEIWPSASTDIVCVGEDLPFADNQFDGVFCIAVLEHMMRPLAVAAEIVRVLKPGGIAYVEWPFLQAVHGYPHHYYNATPQGTIAAFQDRCEILSSEIGFWHHPSYVLALLWQVEGTDRNRH